MAEKKKLARPDVPVFVADETDEERTKKLSAYHDAVVAWQQQQPVIESEDELNDLDDLNEGPFFVDQWNRNIIIRGMSRDEYIELDSKSRQDGKLDEEKLGREAIKLCTVKPKLSPDSPLGKKHPLAIASISNEILRRSGVLGEVAAEVAANFQS